MQSVNARLTIDFSLLDHFEKINEKKQIDCSVEWEIKEHNTKINLEIYFPTSEVSVYNKLFGVLHDDVSNLREVLVFDEISDSDIEKIVLDNPGSFETRAAANNNGNFVYRFEFYYLEIHWRNGKNDSCEANMYLGDNTLKFFKREFYNHHLDKSYKKPQDVELHFKYKSELDYIDIGEILFLPYLNVYDVKFQEKESSFKYEPVVKIRFKSDIEIEKLKKYFDIICGLFSLYSYSYIDYLKVQIFLENKYIEVYHTSKSNKFYKHSDIPYIFKFEKPHVFFQKFNYQILLDKVELLRIIVNNSLLAFSGEGETRFIFYYIILEQIKDDELRKDKNIYFKLNITDEKEIEDKLQQIHTILSSLVVEEEQKEFEKKYNDSKMDILIRIMKKQFSIFLDKYKIDVKDQYSFDFEEAVQIRNRIFHGLPLRLSDHKKMKKFLLYKKFPRLVEDVIFKYFGADPYEVRYKNLMNAKK